VAKKFVYVKRFVGEPKQDDFRLEEETLPALGDKDVLVEASYLSVDQYMRAYMDRYPLGVTMIGGQVGRVVDSKSEQFPKGANVFGQFGWRTHTIFNATENKEPYILPPFGDHPLSLGLGTLGMPGNTAYFGLLEMCRPKAGEVVVVTGAGGAVGSLVGQLAKLKGCQVIGFTGTDAKCNWLKNELRFDRAINYKSANVKGELRAAAPDGIDCYFDNVGGELSSVIMNQMRQYGRIAVCGAISSYNTPFAQWPKLPILQPLFVTKELKMEGFIVTRYNDRWMEGITKLAQWVAQGKIKYEETITNGFENTPQALIDLLRGKNTGKAVVKI